MRVPHDWAKVSALAIAAAVGAALPAHAQNFNWTGFYAGLNAGGAWSDGDFSTASACRPSATSSYPCTSGTPAGFVNATRLEGAGSGSASGSGFVGGAQAGYNWQSGNFVYGTEVDFGAFSLSSSRTATGVYVGTPGVTAGTAFNLRTSVDTDWLMTARARLGWASGPMLIYATGGLALTNAKVGFTYSDNNNFTGNPGRGSASSSDTKTGWTVGGGLEWAFNRNWTFKAEYLYVDFGSLTASGQISTAPPFGYSSGLSTKADLNGHIARAGVNYKF